MGLGREKLNQKFGSFFSFSFYSCRWKGFVHTFFPQKLKNMSSKSYSHRAIAGENLYISPCHWECIENAHDVDIMMHLNAYQEPISLHIIYANYLHWIFTYMTPTSPKLYEVASNYDNTNSNCKVMQFVEICILASGIYLWDMGWNLSCKFYLCN